MMNPLIFAEAAYSPVRMWSTLGQFPKVREVYPIERMAHHRYFSYVLKRIEELLILLQHLGYGFFESVERVLRGVFGICEHSAITVAVFIKFWLPLDRVAMPEYQIIENRGPSMKVQDPLDLNAVNLL